MHKSRQLLRSIFAKVNTLASVLFVLVFVFSAVYTYTRVYTPAPVYAATSSSLNFQARLLQANGSQVPDGYYNIEFNVYNVASGGTSEWTETRTGANKVRVVNGYLSVSLADVTAFPGTINWDQDHWLTMNIGGTGAPSWDGEMTPRLKLTAVPYAFQAKQAELLKQAQGANTGTLDFLALTANRNISLPDQDGTLCIQGSADCVDVATTGTTALTSNNSGLEISSNGLRLLGGCADGQALHWNATSSVWECASGGATIVARESDGTPSASTSTIEFGPATNSDDEFSVTAQGGGVTRIRLGTTVITTNNYAAALDAAYVNAAESPAAGDISGSFTAGLSVNDVQNNAVDLGAETMGDYVQNLGTLVGLSTSGNSGEGSTPGLSVLYGSGANNAAAGANTFTCTSGTGNLTGGGTVVTIGTSGTTCAAVNTNAAVSFGTSVTTPLVTSAGQLDISSTATAGADDIVFNNAGAESLRILENGDLKFERGTNDAFFSVATPSGAPATYTFSGATGTVLTSANFSGSLDGIYVNEGQSPAAGDVSGSFSGGLLVNSVQGNSVDLTTDTVGNYVASITAGGGLTGTAASEGSTPTLAIGAGNGVTVNADDIAVIYGSGANTAVQGNVTIVCPSGTGDLVGTGNTVTLGSGGTCNSITISEAPVFDTSVTTPLLIAAGALTIQTTATGGADDIIFQTAGTEKLRLLENGQLVFGTGANSANLYLSANDTLRTDDNLVVGGATNGLFMGDVGWAGLNGYGVAHTSLVAQTTYALLQINTGATFLNAASGQGVYIRIGNSSTNQAVFSGTGLTLNGTTSNLLVAGTGNSTFAGNIDIAGTLAVGNTDAVTIAASGLITTANDLMVNGGNIDSSGALAVASGGSSALTLTSASGTVVLGSSTLQRSASSFTFDLANAGTSTFNIGNSNGSNLANLDVSGAISAGNGNAFVVNADGDVTSNITSLDGTDQANGSSGLGTSTSLTIDDASDFNVGNYVQMSSANCGGTGINPCYAKITAKSTNTLTITPALRWTDNSAVSEYHVPEIGGTNTGSTLANRYGRGYFISGVATGNGTTFYNEDSIETSLTTFNLVNENVTTLNIGAATSTLNIGSAATTVSILGSLQTAASETITAGGGLIVSNGGAIITGGVDNNSGGITNTGAVSGVSTINASGLVTSVGLTAGSGLIQGTGGLTITGAVSFDGALSDPTGNLVLGDIVDIGSATTGLQISTDGVITDLDDTAIAFGEGLEVTGNSTITGTLMTYSGGYSAFASDATLNAYGFFRSVSTSDAVSYFELGAYDISGGSQGGRALVLNSLGGNVGIGSDTTPDGLFSVGSSSQFQVSSIGAVTAVGLNSGTGLIQGTGGLTITGAISLDGALSDPTGSLVLDDQLSLGSATTGLQITVDGVITDLDDASVTVGQNFAVTTGGISVTGNSTIAGTLGSLAGITFASGSLDINNGGVVNAGSIAGATTITASDLITANGGLTVQSGDTFTVGNEGFTDLTGNGLVISGSNLTINQDYSFAWTAAQAWNLNDTEGITVNSTVGGTNSSTAQTITITNSSSSGTQRGLYINNAASTGTTDALMVLDNSDTDTLVTSAIQILNTSRFTNLFDVGGTLISVSEFTVLDGGLALTETSGTLTTDRGGTGLTSFTANGLFYASSTSAVSQLTGTSGQVLLANGSGVPGFTTLSGDVTINGTGVTAIGADTVALATDTTGNYVATVTVGNGLAVSGVGSENSTAAISLDVATTGTTSTTSSNSGLELAAAGLSLFRGCSNGQVMEWNGNTSVWNCATDNTGVSDSALKTNVANHSSVLDQIKNIRVVDYNFKCTDPLYVSWRLTCDNQTGIIAQELDLIFPDLVTLNAQGINEVDFGALNFYTLKAVTELANFVEADGDGKLKDLYTSNTLRLSSTGALQNITGLTITSGGASITGGLNNNSGGITDTGSIAGATTVNASGLATLSGGITASGGTISLNSNALTATTNIGTGTTTGLVSIGGGANNLAIDTLSWDISSSGAVSGLTTIGASGLATLSGGLTLTGTTNINNNAATATTNIGTGTTTGAITIGGGLNSFALNSTAFDVSSGGALSGITTLAATGAISSTVGNISTTSGVYQQAGLSGVTVAACTAGQYIGNGVRVSGGIITAGTCRNDATGISDERVKKNITAIDSVFDRIGDLNVVSFDFKVEELPELNLDRGLQYGVIAQQLEQLFPELVNTRPDGYKEVNFQGLSFYNLKAVGEIAKYLDSGGNANLNTANINNLKVNGVLEAGTIRADHIEGLDYLGRIDSLESRINAIEQRPTGGTTQQVDTTNFQAGTITATGATDLQKLTVNLDLVVKGAMEVDGPATFKEAVKFQKDVEFDGQVNVLGYSNVQGLTVNLDLIVRGSLKLDGPATFKEAALFQSNATFESSVGFKGQVTYNNDAAGYVTIRPGESSTTVQFKKKKDRPPVISLNVGNGKFVQYSYNNVTEEGFDVVLAAPATETLTFSWVAVQTEEVVSQAP